MATSNPTAIPGGKNLPMASLITLDGELIPSAPLKPSITPFAKSPIFPSNQSFAFLMPFQMPSTIYLPISAIFPGNPERVLTIPSHSDLAASIPFEPILTTNSATFPIAFDNTLQICPGNPVTKLMMLDTKFDPASYPLEIKFKANSATFPMISVIYVQN